MLASEMIQEMRDHGFDDIDPVRALSFLNDTYYEFCSIEVWPFLETSIATVATVVGEPILTNLPADWRAILGIINLTTGNTLSPERRDTIMKRFAPYLSQRGEPEFYYRRGTSILQWAVPGSIYTYQVDYVKRPAALTTPAVGSLPDTSPIFPVDHHRLLVLGALSKASQMEDDPDNSSYYDNLYEKKLVRVRNDLWGWQYDRTERIVDIFEDNDAWEY